ncbi:MAG: hypothetical protein ACI8ZB_004771 [Desulforhopalus sp.]|jgi:hypothetical protein
MEEQAIPAAVTLSVLPDSVHFFTTVLQSGVEVKTSIATEIGAFLCQLPGFTPEYIASTVETIFLNGTPVDDLTLSFTGKAPVLALSASMPGLAGAIFRRNSIHSALRTQTDSSNHVSSDDQATTVTLKLFNSIAKERGAILLETGVTIKAAKVLTFLQKQTGLCDYITDIELNSEAVNITTLFTSLSEAQTIHLKVKNSHG